MSRRLRFLPGRRQLRLAQLRERFQMQTRPHSQVMVQPTSLLINPLSQKQLVSTQLPLMIRRDQWLLLWPLS